MKHLPTIPLFPAGQIVATPGALALLERANKTLEYLSVTCEAAGAMFARKTRPRTN